MSRHILAAALLAAAVASPAAAVSDFSFTGSFTDPNQVQFFDFRVSAPSQVTLRTWGFAGGVNAAGATVGRGGFDTMLWLFERPGGALVDENDDGDDDQVAIDPVSDTARDSFLQTMLQPGEYRLALSVYDNAPTGGAFDPFDNTGRENFNNRSGDWAVDILGVDSAGLTAPAVVPEPATWAMMILGFGMVGASMRRRATPRVAA